jgi:RHS repeat-associated protein
MKVIPTFIQEAREALSMVAKTCAGHYHYDIHGNVDTLLQDNQQLSLISTSLQPQRFKKIIYDFDLISGNVNLVSYQDGEPDAFYHFYEYDADNRIIAVYSSNYPQKNALINLNTVSNSPLWDNDAKYFYYAHGPLARTEYGDNKVQGQDYAYTLQGWIKGVNSNTLDTLRDIGKDGAIGSINSIFAKDAFGYTLNYHANDYKAIDGLKWNNANNRFESVIAGSDLNNSRNDLFNGNITSMVTTIEKPMIYTAAANQAPTVMAQGTAYRYDQLNRIKEMKAFANLDFTTNTWQSGSTYAGMYHNRFNYDANGNIQWQQRADSTGTIFDKLSYRYKLDPTGRLFQNRLYHVNDSVTNRSLVKDDIDDEGLFTATADTINDINNYRYDEIGELKHDSQEEIDTITWTVYNKIKKIVRTDTSSKPDLEFNYDAMGNRISKIVKPHGSSVENGGTDIPTQWTSTYYVRDRQGNIMTTYKLAAPAMASSFKVTERNLFGSSRLGTDDSQIELIAALPTANPYTRTLGNKHYEAVNHLDNVLTVFTDRKIPITSNSTTIDHFDADVVNTFDYSPFGAPMNERTYRLVTKYTDSTHTTTLPAFVNGNEPFANIANDSLSYRYGFNGKEKDNEVEGEGNEYNFGARINSPRLGRFLSTDPVAKMYPNISPYAFVANSPILFVDSDGKLLKDANGNIIYTKGKVETIPYGKYITATITHVKIYTNDGSKHEALIVTFKNSKGEDITEDVKRLTYDCHGLVKTEGKMLIESSNEKGDVIEGILKGDSKGKLQESNSIEQAKKGDILVFRDDQKQIIHTAICNDDEACSYNSKNGSVYSEEKTASLENLEQIYGTDVSVVPKQEDKTVESLNKKGENGVAEYSKKEVKQALKAAKKEAKQEAKKQKNEKKKG